MPPADSVATVASSRAMRASRAPTDTSPSVRESLTTATSRGMRGSGAWRISNRASPMASRARVVARSPS